MNEKQTNLTPAEALYGFVAWLTTRNVIFIVGAKRDPAPMVRALQDWCAANMIEPPGDGFPSKEIREPVKGNDQ